MKKTALILFAAFIAAAIFSYGCFAETENDCYTDTPQGLFAADGENIITEDMLSPDVLEFIDEQPFTIEQLKEMTFPQVLAALWAKLKISAQKPVKLFIRLCAVLILAAVLRRFAFGDTRGGLHTSADTAVTVAMFVIISSPLLQLLQEIETTMVTVKDTVTCFVPVFSSVMVSCGQPATAVIYSGMFLSAISFVIYILVQYMLPFLKVFMALNITGGISGNIKLDGITSVIARAVKWVLGLLSTVFAAVLSIQTYISQGTDSIAVRAGKFVLGSGIPVIGRAVSDAMGTVISGLKVVKGVVGILGIAGLAAVFLPVLLTSVTYYLALLLAGGVADALYNTKGAAVLKGFCECISICIAIIAFFAMLVIFATVIMIMAGGGA